MEEFSPQECITQLQDTLQAMQEDLDTYEREFDRHMSELALWHDCIQWRRSEIKFWATQLCRGYEARLAKNETPDGR